jgi:hypothetical protein
VSAQRKDRHDEGVVSQIWCGYPSTFGFSFFDFRAFRPPYGFRSWQAVVTTGDDNIHLISSTQAGYAMVFLAALLAASRTRKKQYEAAGLLPHNTEKSSWERVPGPF